MSDFDLPAPSGADNPSDVIRLNEVAVTEVARFLASQGMVLTPVDTVQPIPGSFWGDSEAGLIGNRLYARPDTPLHSILHEACHYLCMDDTRRANLHTNAGGDYEEENAVCYLQIRLADQLPGYSGERCLADMDRWGYSFRLGSARAWYEHDAEDARQWLQSRGLL